MPRLPFSSLAVPAAACLLFATGCSSPEDDAGTGGEAAPPAESAGAGAQESPAQDGAAAGEGAVDLVLSYTSAESAGIGLHGQGAGPSSGDAASEFGSDVLTMDDATCTGTAELVDFEATDELGTLVSGQVAADGTGSLYIDQPDNESHPGWLSVSNGSGQTGTWSRSEDVVMLTEIAMNTVDLAGTASLSGEVTCTVFEIF
ncbi:hypothetical protein [Nocardiopsis flavescens]